MTLFRQLISTVVILFVTLYAVNLFISVSNSRLLVSEQMKTHAQDTATSLGLSLTQIVDINDSASIETIFNAVSDSSYFQKIYLKDVSGKTLVERNFTVSVSGVPSWFINMIDLSAQEGVAEVNSGWQKLGAVTVVSHPGQAYLKLWKITTNQLTWFALVTMLVCFFAAACLRWLLVPLQKVEQQADAIVERRFEVQETLPKTRELKQVVQAMNRMSSKLKEIFDEQVLLISRLREQSVLDPVTGLPNREEFDAQFTSAVYPESGSRAGALMIITFDGLLEINDFSGREEGNAVLANIGRSIQTATASCPGALISRRQGAEFAVFLPDIDLSQATALSKEAFEAAKGVTWQHNEKNPLVFYMGFSFNEEISEPQSLLNEADIALKKAQINGPNQWCAFADVAESEAPVLSKPVLEWQTYLEDCLQQRNIELHVQPLLSVPDKKLVANEAYVRFKSEGNLLPAGVVIPIAERLGLMCELEKIVIETAITRLNTLKSDIILNLSSVSLRDEGFLQWLDQHLKSSKKASRLHFEVSEHTMHTSVDQVEELNKVLFKHGSKLGIDHFGLETSSFSYLSRFSLAYLKVHRSFVAGLHNNPDNQFYIQMLGNLAKSLDIEVRVEGVETKEDFEVLNSLGVNSAQGYFLGMPQ